jgi:hypothetical protein
MAVSTISQAGLDSPITLTNPVISSIVNTGTLTLPTTTGTLALQSDVIGIGQTWQTVTRTSGTTYTNSTGKPITAFVTFAGAGTVGTLNITIGGVSLSGVNAPNGAVSGYTFIIPNGQTYVFTFSNANTINCQELR